MCIRDRHCTYIVVWFRASEQVPISQEFFVSSEECQFLTVIQSVCDSVCVSCKLCLIEFWIQRIVMRGEIYLWESTFSPTPGCSSDLTTTPSRRSTWLTQQTEKTEYIMKEIIHNVYYLFDISDRTGHYFHFPKLALWVLQGLCMHMNLSFFVARQPS